MLREILNEAASLVSLMLFGASILIWGAVLSELSQSW